MVRSIELFSGTGGFALGLHQAGFNPKALFEWDKKACENIIANKQNGYIKINDWNIVQTDVRNVNFSSYGPDIQFITGGPPCQPFSLGGKHKANNDVRDMFPEAVRAVRELKPKGFIFENVKGLLRKSFRPYFDYLLLQLSHPEIIASENMDWTEHLKVLENYHSSKGNKGLEYNVTYQLVNAADYGVPQQRHRVIIIGFRNDFDFDWSFPEPTHSKEALFYAKNIDKSYWDEHKIATNKRPEISRIDKQMVQMIDKMILGNRWQTVRDAITGLPNPQGKSANNFFNHEFRGGAKKYNGHSGSVLDEPSKTIKAGAHGVPGGENMFSLDDGSLRYYTVRESARLQTFPDNYIFLGSWSESMRQIGNAVPVKLATIIGESIISHIKKIGDDYAEYRETNNKTIQPA